MEQAQPPNPPHENKLPQAAAVCSRDAAHEWRGGEGASDAVWRRDKAGRAKGSFVVHPVRCAWEPDPGPELQDTHTRDPQAINLHENVGTDVGFRPVPLVA